MNIQIQKIAIYGAGGFGREIAWLAESCRNQSCEVVCFIDDSPAQQGKAVNDIPVMSLEEASQLMPTAKVVSAIGSPGVRKVLMEKVKQAGFEFGILIHSRTEMSRWIKIGKGTIICAGCILTTNITLGKHVQINLDCTIGHDVIMEDYATLASGVHVSGCVHLGKRVYVGTGAVIINGTQDKPIIIGDDAIIGAGACVIKSIPPGTTCEGSACKTPLVKLTLSDRFANWQYPEIEEGKLTKYNWLVQHKSNLKLGYKTDIGAFVYINAKNIVVIEDYVQVGSHCSIYSISTIDNKEGKVVLKENCKIGSHSLIMPGVTIGENSIVGAFSFVNRDIPDNVIAMGIPAKVIRRII